MTPPERPYLPNRNDHLQPHRRPLMTVLVIVGGLAAGALLVDLFIIRPLHRKS